jgi:hypothetical protein
MLTDMIQVTNTTDDAANTCNVTQLLVPKMKYPQKLTMRRIEALHSISQNFEDDVAAMMKEEMDEVEAAKAEKKSMLDSVRSHGSKSGGSGFAAKEPEKTNYYKTDKQTIEKKKKNKRK